jgi:hypothetical protein
MILAGTIVMPQYKQTYKHMIFIVTFHLFEIMRI